VCGDQRATINVRPAEDGDAYRVASALWVEPLRGDLRMSQTIPSALKLKERHCSVYLSPDALISIDMYETVSFLYFCRRMA
jgi:hypothetical protein